MPKDPLLAEDFFSLHRLSHSEIRLALEELNKLEQVIKQKLYPHLSTDQKPTYYQGGRSLDDLNKFVYQNEASSLHSDNFKFLQVELKLSVMHIRLWVITHQLEGSETLAAFAKKIEHPSDNMSLLYGDGKFLLEKVAVLLDEPLIALEDRKKIMVNLLADKELEKCIAGCYTRIANAALQLHENLDTKLQIKQWLRSFAKVTASYIAAKRPFAMPDTYQVMLCKASDSAVEQNLLHANNYLLMQAKEHGFPVDFERDQGAIELGNGLTAMNKKAIIDLYIRDLEQQITAKNLVIYMSEKLHVSFTQILGEESDYADKSARILNKLNVLGEDAWFKTHKIGLEEILAENGGLKSVEALQITITQRLQARKLLTDYQAKRLVLAGGKLLEYYELNSEISFTWFWVDNQRIPLLNLIKTDRLATLIPLTHLQANVRQFNFNEVIHHFIKDTDSLISVIKNLPISSHFFLENSESLHRIATFIKNSNSVKSFNELLSGLPDQSKRKMFITECGHEFVKKMVYKGLIEVDIKTVMPGLTINYLTEDYLGISRQEALSFSKGLIKQLIDNEFNEFSHINFIKLPHPYLEEIDFSDTNLQFAKFFQPVRHCQFDRSKLDNVIFFERLEHIAFKTTDLRKVVFQSPINIQYSEIDLENAKLSTEAFKGLRSAYVVNFVGANFQEVDFQDVLIKLRLQYLDFTKANLEESDLSKLKLTSSVFWEANLGKANLIGTDLSQIAINPDTNLEASQLDLSTVDYLYRRGIRNFAGCKIYTERSSDEPSEFYSFYSMNFKKTEFIGESLFINFHQSDLSTALFTPKTVTQHASSMMLSVAFKESQLDRATFRHVKFSSDSIILSSRFTQLNFDQTEISARLLFALYEEGQRDFMGIKALKGTIPQKLVAFPVLGAKLKKDSFLHLYRQGLRDFRGSNLNSFYLSQVLTEQAISAIELKLEGAEYKQSPLGCVSGPRHKRAVLLASFCTVHFLFQKTNTEKKVTLNDIEVFALASRERFSIKELVLGPKPLYILSDEVNEVNFYWGYRPDEEVLTKLDSFTKKSIHAFEVSERKQINLRFHFSKKFSDTTSLNEFARNIGQLGFSDVKLNYYNQHTQLSRIELKNGVTSITSVSMIQGQILHTDKFRDLLKNVKLSTLKAYNKEEYRARLRRINSEVRRKLGSGIRTGVRNGAQYEIGATIIYFIGEAINNPRSGEIRVIEAENKTVLKQLAYHLAQEVGQERGASESQVNVTARVAEQCIDRGECFTEEQVIRDVVDSMQRIRPDIVIGNERAWNITKDFFVNIGSYVSDKFDELKQFFSVTHNQSLPTEARYWGPSTGIFQLSRIQKRSLSNWYESSLLMRFIKNIEMIFEGFECDLLQDEDFSEERIAGFISELWQALANCGVNNNVTEEFILNALTKLENNIFLTNDFNVSQKVCSMETELTTPLLPQVVNVANDRVGSRRRRQISPHVDEFDIVKKETDRKILTLDDNYHLQFLGKKKHAQQYNKQTKIIDKGSLKKAPSIPDYRNKTLNQERNFQPKKLIIKNTKLPQKYINTNYFKNNSKQHDPAVFIKYSKKDPSGINKNRVYLLKKIIII